MSAFADSGAMEVDEEYVADGEQLTAIEELAMARQERVEEREEFSQKYALLKIAPQAIKYYFKQLHRHSNDEESFW